MVDEAEWQAEIYDIGPHVTGSAFDVFGRTHLYMVVEKILISLLAHFHLIGSHIISRRLHDHLG